jgi:hypothetical protein
MAHQARIVNCHARSSRLASIFGPLCQQFQTHMAAAVALVAAPLKNAAEWS